VDFCIGIDSYKFNAFSLIKDNDGSSFDSGDFPIKHETP
jgi:hypothetical protein